MLQKKRCSIIIVAYYVFAIPTFAQADSPTNFIQKSDISGTIRSCYFSKLYGAAAENNMGAYSLGGILNVKTAPFLGGFIVGVSFFTANDLGTHGNNPKNVDTTLMGIASSINALGQSYIQYEIPHRLLVRAGNQMINTPWMGPRDSRMLPQTFQGMFVRITPVSGLNLEAMRIFRWKSRTSDDYYKDNLYYDTNYYNDPLYDVTAVLPKNAGKFQGTLAFGATYKARGTDVQTWYYNFYQFAQMFYGSAAYTLKTGAEFFPFAAMQYMREWQVNSAFQKYDAKLFGQSGSVNATLWGGEVGVKIPSGKVFVAYNTLTPHAGSFGGGAIISPYGNYNATYSSFITDNLLAFGPGHAWRVAASYRLWQKQIILMAGYSHFNTNYEGRTHGVYLDVTYVPKMLKGFTIRDQVAIDNGLQAYAGRSFIYNRMMLQYAF